MCSRCLVNNVKVQTLRGSSFAVAGIKVKIEAVITQQAAIVGSPPDNCIPLGHLAGAKSKAGCDDCRQALRNGSDSQRHCNLEVVYASRKGELNGGGVW